MASKARPCDERRNQNQLYRHRFLGLFIATTRQSALLIHVAFFFHFFKNRVFTVWAILGGSKFFPLFPYLCLNRVSDDVGQVTDENYPALLGYTSVMCGPPRQRGASSKQLSGSGVPYFILLTVITRFLMATIHQDPPGQMLLE